MQRDAKRPGSTLQTTRVADLRASLRATRGGALKDAPALPKAPQPPRRATKRETDEERALKAEKQAQLQHTTSLLKGGNSKKPYVRPGERETRKGGLFGQLLLVMIVAGGVAYALDPTIVPADWTSKAHAFISQYVKL
jgi:hypothetical protein